MKKLKRKSIIIILLIVSIITILFTYKDKNGENLRFVKYLKNMFTYNSVSLTPREVLNFNYDWQFSKGEGVNNSNSTVSSSNVLVIANPTSSSEERNIPYSPNYEFGNTWEDVSLPHTYNDVDTFNNLMETSSNGERSMYTGTAWYKKTFFLPSSYENKKIYIEFESARQMVKVYINGTLLEGVYQNGFIAFGYDLTPFVNFNANNDITVLVDNSYPYYYINDSGVKTTNMIPWHDSHWHPTMGGLSDNVNLYVVDKLHLTLPLYSFIEGQGTYIYTTDETSDTAKIHVDAEVENNTGSVAEFKVRSIIRDIMGTTVLTLNSENQTLNNDTKSIVNLSGTLENVIRWSDTYPYLYTVTTQILDSGNNVIDQNEYHYGIRTYRMTTDSGFYLNENYTILNGWGQKSTNEWAGIGSAYPVWMQDYVIKKMKDANANYIRWGHTAGKKSQIEASDKYGLIVLQPGVDAEGETESSYNTDAYKLRIEAMRDLVIYFRNSTSILMWEMGNQAQGLSKTASHDLIASIDGLSFPYESTDVIPYSRVLYEIVNQFDYGNRSDIRANIGTHATSTPSSDRLIAIRRADNVRTILDYVDVVEITEGGASSITSKPLIEGEYNRLEVRRGVWDNYTPGYENFKNVSSSPDYVNVTNESYALSQITKYNTVYNNTHYVGGANWIFSDTISHGRVNSEVARATGEVDAVMLEKPSYYANQVLFAKNPQVYIVGHWNYEAGTIKPVYVIGKNVASVELLVNGISLGNGVLTDEYIFKFNNVVYGAGTITAKGKNIAGEVIAEYSITTHGEPTKLKITPIVGPSGLRATGNDILLLDVEVLDANNNRCLTFDGVRDNITTTFTVNEGIAENTAVWLGGYNSSIPELTRTNTLKIENGITRVSLRTTRTSGTIKVKAETPNLTSAEITTTSSELMNTFGYTATMEPKTTYDLTSLTPTTYGTGAHLGQEGENEIPSTLLLSNFMYTGTTNANNGIYDALQVGSRAYSDSSVTFSSIPYAYLNAEYLRIPSIDTSPSLGVDLINIAAKRSIDVLIFYDANYEIPTWMVNEGFIPTGKTVTASDGTSYAVYSISITPGTLTTLGSNGNINAKMYIVAVKETDQIENIIFYYDKFNYIDDYAIKNGYNRKIEPIANANVSINNTVTLSTVEKGTGNVTQTGENVLQFNSNGEGEIAYIQKQFAAQTGRFSVSFDALVRKMDYPSYNTYIRVWFGSDYISHENDKDKLKVESYLTRLNDSVLLTQRSTTQNSAINTVYTGTNNIDKLVNYCYEFDMEARNYNIYIDNTLVTTTPINFIVNSNTDNFIDTIIIGTSKGTRADFYIDNLKIMPEVANVISGIKIDGNLIPSFDSLVNNYEVSYPIGTNSNIELITEELFDSYTVEYKKNEDKLYIRVIDSYGNTLTYVISSSIVTRLEGKTIHEEENTSIEVATIDGVEAIHFSDESDLNSTPASKFAYLSREFSDMTNKFTVKFDAYVSSTPTDTTANTWLRTWLSDGPMLINPLSEEEKKNLAVQLYLHKNTNGTFDLMGRESGSTASNNMYVVKNMSLDSWHKFSYEIDVPHHCLDIYVDGNLVYSDFDFFVDEDKINTMTFATGKNTKSNFYINNFDVTVSPPISNILVNNIPVDNFNSSVNTYTFESSTEFNSNTIVGLITNEYYKSHTVENNYNNDISVITITDILDDKWTYTVHHNYILSANKTKQDLIDFITYINNNYTENEFTENTWAILVDSLIYANEVIADDNSTEETYTLAYQELQASIGTLLTPVVNVNGQTDLINLQIYSSDLLNNYTYEEILENGAYVYNSENNSFSSVPYKYLNAEYLRLPNDYASHGLLKITPMRNISMLVLKDRLSGVFTESGFSYTGDIITSSDGVVYKVYRKDLNTPDQLTLDLMDYITNKNTGIPNILAFIETEKLTDNYFVKEIFNDFIETDNFSQFNTSWQFLNHVGNTGVLPSTTDIKNLTLLNVPGKYLEMHSPGLDSYRGTLKYFAKQNDKFSFRYKILIDPNDPDNTYLRTWLSSGSPLEVDPTNTSITRPNVGVEAYAHATNKSNASTYGLYYRHSANNTIHLITNYSKNIWVDIEFIVDVVNHTFTVRVGPEGETITEYTNTLAGYKFFRNVNDLNCLSFWTRQSGSSLHYFKEVYVTPITRNILSNIKVDGNNVNSFHDLTKAYLYKYTNGDDLNLTRVETTNFSSGTLTKNTGYDALTVTDTNNYNYNYEVYYELNVDKTLLSETIKEAEEVKRYRYTQVTYGDVSIALSNAKLVASSITATQEDVNTATTNLRNAIDALVLISLNVYNYDVKTIIDRNYDDFVNMEVNITPKSAFTANFTFNQEYAGGYTFSGKTHTRTLVTTSILPAGTKITFIDNSTSDYQAYYYIISNEDVLNNKKEIPFTDFIKMGTSTHYVD